MKMLVDVEFNNLKSAIGCFWKNDAGWHGVLNGGGESSELKLIRSEDLILVLRKEDLREPVPVASGNTAASR